MDPYAEAVIVGTELLLGSHADTNGPAIGARTAPLGCPLRRITVVGDTDAELDDAIGRATARHPVVFVTGGLGPTEDDRTRFSVARVTGRELEFRPDLMAHIESLMARFGRAVPPSNRVQALLPTGADAIPNPRGTAPGFALETGGTWLVALPGVPRELAGMLDDWVVPRLARRLGIRGFATRTVRLSGPGESRVGEAVADLMGPDRDPYVGILASPGEVRVVITSRAETDARARVARVEAEVCRRLGRYVFGTDRQTHAAAALEAAADRGWTVATADGYTPGILAGWLATSGRPGFRGGLVLPPAADGSEPDALAAAARARAAFGADAGVAVVGDPLGDRGAWIGLDTPAARQVHRFRPGLGPEADRFRAAHLALYRFRRLAAPQDR